MNDISTQNKMFAAVCDNAESGLSVKSVSVPILQKAHKRKVLVKIICSGVCHTDLHAVDGDWQIKPAYPFIPGHEGVGIVQSMTDDVEHLKVGDRVGIAWLHSACGHCSHCYGGNENLCEHQKNSGYGTDGTLAEYCLADADYVARIPHEIKDEKLIKVAPLLCAGLTVYRGLKETQAKAGDWVAIVGVGGLGHLAIQYAKVMGLNVAAIDIDDEKLRLAKICGADIIVNSADENAKEKMAAMKLSEFFHGVLVTAANKAAFVNAVSMTRRGGKAVLVGLPDGTFPLSIFDTVLRGISVVGSIVGTRLDLQRTLQIALDKNIAVHVNIKGIQDIPQIFKDMRCGAILGRDVVVMPEFWQKFGDRPREDIAKAA